MKFMFLSWRLTYYIISSRQYFPDRSFTRITTIGFYLHKITYTNRIGGSNVFQSQLTNNPAGNNPSILDSDIMPATGNPYNYSLHIKSESMEQKTRAHP